MYNFRRQLLKLPTFYNRQGLYFADKADSKASKTPQKKVKMVIVPYNKIHRDETSFEFNERLGRFYSPHMTIYEMQITSVLSFMHRIAGTAISGYFSGLGLSAFVLPYNMLDTVTYIQDLINEYHIPGALLILAKICVTLPFAFHVANGIRHLVWDTGCCLTNDGVVKTGYAALATTAILCAILTFL